ncbi:glycosyltransferase family A protein [Pontibacter sp. H259]|uniref:glycosyltransferase family 2 protein n=1 Tax=Pontibacter sp. H259 TaxID=3133421 RepID=UPI0030C2F590
MLPKASIIIPCYNSGSFLPDAIESIKLCSNKNKYEVVIVNDGSTDLETLELLDKLAAEGYTVLHQENQGPAAARNTGVKYAKSKYIFFLDSDNKVRPDYIEKGIKILEDNPDTGIVYGNPSFFGDSLEARFCPYEFNLDKLLLENYIDMCSLIRKRVWEEVGGLDENHIIIGHEDWDFWIRAATAGWKFYYINETLYDYRIRNNSLVMGAVQNESHQQMLSYFYGKHYRLLIEVNRQLQRECDFMKGQIAFYEHDKAKPFRSFLKYSYNKFIKK